MYVKGGDTETRGGGVRGPEEENGRGEASPAQTGTYHALP